MQESSPPRRQGNKRDSSPVKAKAPGSKGGGRAKGRGRGRLSAEAITAAAIRIADSDGLGAVSIRRVAAELDARPMTLYSHISSKDALLASMAEEVVAEILVQEPLPEAWREALETIMRRYVAAFLAHPWAAGLFLSHSMFGANSTRLAKQTARAVASLPLEPADVWLLLGTVIDYVLGFSLRAVSAPATAELADAIDPTDVVEFPELATLQDSLRARSSLERFERGLQIVLDGVERRFLGPAGG